MTRDKQMEIVTDLLDRLKTEMLEKITMARIPEHWDGIELRRYISDKAQERILMGTMDRRRMRAYRNDVIVNNL